jgi:hypothetical protein
LSTADCHKLEREHELIQNETLHRQHHHLESESMVDNFKEISILSDDCDAKIGEFSIESYLTASLDEVSPDTLSLYPYNSIVIADVGNHIIVRIGSEVEQKGKYI